MDELGNHLFSGTALAGNHHRCVGLGDTSRQLDGALEGRGGTEQQYFLAVAGFSNHRLVHRLGLARDPNRVRGTAEKHLEMGRREWLG